MHVRRAGADEMAQHGADVTTVALLLDAVVLIGGVVTSAEEQSLAERAERREEGRARLRARRRADRPQLDLFGRKTG